MTEELPSLEKTANAAKPRVSSRWLWLGPLLGLASVIAGVVGWESWKHYSFKKERMETPPHLVADLKLKLLWIPAGTFTMGLNNEAKWVQDMKWKFNQLGPDYIFLPFHEASENEGPAHKVTFTKGFYLGETEVTQAQWEGVMGSNPSEFKYPKEPVENVSWDDCVEFCRKLTERERAAGRIGPKQIFQLPTEAEWEYACRAGSPGEYFQE